MSECKNERVRCMLCAWELDALSEEDRREVDLHIMECQDCFQELQQFRHEAALLQSDTQARDIVALADRSVTETDAPVPRSRRWAKISSPLLLAAAIIVILIVQPWRLEFHSTDEIRADEHRIAIFHFENLSSFQDSLEMGRIIANLLIVNLSESASIPVLADVTVQEYLESYRMSAGEAQVKGSVSEVARRAGARWMITGRIIETQPAIRIVSDVVDLRTGNVAASQQLNCESDDDIFDAADKLAEAIRRDLSLPLTTGATLDRMVAEMTTHSPLAYHYYLNGVDQFNKLYYDEAIASLNNALALDSTFALAYYYLSHMTDPSLVLQAARYSENVGRLDQHYISARAALHKGDTATYAAELKTIVQEFPDQGYALYLLGIYTERAGEFHRARDYYLRATKASPRFKPTYNRLAYLYQRLRVPDSALWAADQYLLLAPDEANPFDTRGDIFVLQERLDSAIVAYQNVMLRKPSFHKTRVKLANLHLFLGDFQEASRLYSERSSAGGTDQELMVANDLSAVALYQGDIAGAQQILEESLSRPFTDMLTEEAAKAKGALLYRLASISREIGDYGQAIDHIRAAMSLVNRLRPEDSVSYRATYIDLLAKASFSREAQDELGRLHEYVNCREPDPSTAYLVHLADGYHAMATDRPHEAVRFLETAAENSPEVDRFRISSALIEAYLQAGQAQDAAALAEKLLDKYSQDRLGLPLLNLKLQYFLGLAYERLGRFGYARVQYRSYLDRWSSWEISPLAASDAAQRLARIDSQF